MARQRLELSGELQRRVMRIIWDLGEGRVDDVRRRLPHGSAYTTVQTVLNRLADRGLVDRERTARGITYRPGISEGEHLSQAVSESLSRASDSARRVALNHLVGELDSQERAELARIVGESNRGSGGR